MLSIVATLKEFWSMLLGANKHVFTNNKNFSFDDLETQWVFALAQQNQRFLLWLHYVKCPQNILVNNLSSWWLHCLPTLSQIECTIVSDYEVEGQAFFTDSEYSGVLDDDINAMLSCYLNLPEIPDPAKSPLSFDCIREEQQQDQQLLVLQVKYPNSTCTNHWMTL